MKKFENPVMNIKEFDRILATEPSNPEPAKLNAVEEAKKSFAQGVSVFEFSL